MGNALGRALRARARACTRARLHCVCRCPWRIAGMTRMRVCVCASARTRMPKTVGWRACLGGAPGRRGPDASAGSDDLIRMRRRRRQRWRSRARGRCAPSSAPDSDDPYQLRLGRPGSNLTRTSDDTDLTSLTGPPHGPRSGDDRRRRRGAVRAAAATAARALWIPHRVRPRVKQCRVLEFFSQVQVCPSQSHSRELWPAPGPPAGRTHPSRIRQRSRAAGPGQAADLTPGAEPGVGSAPCRTGPAGPARNPPGIRSDSRISTGVGSAPVLTSWRRVRFDYSVACPPRSVGDAPVLTSLRCARFDQLVARPF